MVITKFLTKGGDDVTGLRVSPVTMTLHQINLVVRNLFEGSTSALLFEAQMRGFIQWWNFYPRPQCLLAEEQVQGRSLVLIRPVLSRWTSHAAAAKRLIKLSIPLQPLVLRKREELLASIAQDRKSQSTAQAILYILRNPLFWNGLTILSRLLEPLSVAALVLQSNATRLDHTLLVIGKLFTQYRQWYQECNEPNDSLENQPALQL